MSTVNTQDLLDLLLILYQGSVRRNHLAVPPVLPNTARFFRKEDIKTVASEYGFPLPESGIDATLSYGLLRGVFQKSIEKGTECGAGFPCFPTLELPTIIYAYNPNMAKISPLNQALIDPFALGMQRIHGSAVLFSNNRAPCYGTRGSATLTQNPIMANTSYRSRRCCSR
jgi:hypothetical protein